MHQCANVQFGPEARKDPRGRLAQHIDAAEREFGHQALEDPLEVFADHPRQLAVLDGSAVLSVCEGDSRLAEDEHNRTVASKDVRG